MSDQANENGTASQYGGKATMDLKKTSDGSYWTGTGGFELVFFVDQAEVVYVPKDNGNGGKIFKSETTTVSVNKYKKITGLF